MLLDHKWSRSDVRTFIEEWTGHSRFELCESELANGGVSRQLKAEILNELAMSAQDMVDGIVHGVDPEFNPVSIRPRREPASGKVRDVAYLDMRHQQLGHIIKLGLEKHLNARMEPCQHASIPKRGQTGLTRQVKRFLNRKLGIKFYQKTDCTAAYASTMYDDVIELIAKELPRAVWIIRCLKTMRDYAPGGHLIIGGYLDAWLFNYIMSYAIRYVSSLYKSRRGNKIPMVIRVVTYMDDMTLFGKSKTAMMRATESLIAWLWATYHIVTRTTTGVIELESVDEEKHRKQSLSKASRQCPMLDMGGYKISRTHISIRRKNIKKIKRCFDRAWAEYKSTGTLKKAKSLRGNLKIWDAQKFGQLYLLSQASCLQVIENSKKDSKLLEQN